MLMLQIKFCDYADQILAGKYLMGGMFSLESSFFDVTVKTANGSPVSNLTKPDILKKRRVQGCVYFRQKG
jgi:hypothetical protein